MPKTTGTSGVNYHVTHKIGRILDTLLTPIRLVTATIPQVGIIRPAELSISDNEGGLNNPEIKYLS